MRGDLFKIVLISSSIVFAQEVQLSGTVVNQAGVPVRGLVISLQKNHLNDTTDAQGKFQLQKSATATAQNFRSLPHRITFTGDRLTVPAATDVGEAGLKLFNLNGALVHAIGGIRPGQAIPISGFIASSKMQLMVVTFGNQTFRFAVMKVNDRIIGREMDGSALSTNIGRSETAVGTSGDSLMIMRKQTVEFAVWRVSLAGDLSIKLDLVPFEIVDLAVAENGRYPDEVGKDLTAYPNAIANYLMKTGTGAHDYEAWCSEFVSWAYKAAGYPLTGGTQGGWMLQGSTQLRSWFQQKAQFIGRTNADWNTFQPAPGDYIRYENSSGGHSGIVRQVSNDTLYSVEGNVNNTVMLRKIPKWRNYQSDGGTTYIDGIGRRSGTMKSTLQPE